MSLSTEPRARGAEVPGSPPATRHRVSLWKDPRLVVGVALVAVSALFGATLLGGADATVGVWAARDALARGQDVGPDDLVRREVRFADRADADRYVSAGSPLPDGAVLLRDVGPGELLPRAALGTGSGVGQVEVPLSVPAEAVPATVRRGSVVDVWVTADPSLAPATKDEQVGSTLVFGRVTVLAVSRSGGALGPSATRQVIVGVEPGQEDTIPAALATIARGSVVLVRRP
ncbi:MAG: SAF domain-containing protein [Nocardioides sp.]